MVGDGALIEIRIFDGGLFPTKAYDGDAGWDLYVANETVLQPFTPTDIPCGFEIGLPHGYWARIAARSSTTRRHGLIIHDAVIDAGYRGPMFVCMTRIEETPLVVQKGWRLAQLILHKVEPVVWLPVSDLSKSSRGSKGFGSSGQ